MLGGTRYPPHRSSWIKVRAWRVTKGKRGTDIHEIWILFEDQDPVTHASERIGRGEAGGGAANDEKVECNHGLVRPVRDCRRHRRRGEEGMREGREEGGGIYKKKREYIRGGSKLLGYRRAELEMTEAETGRWKGLDVRLEMSRTASRLCFQGTMLARSNRRLRLPHPRSLLARSRTRQVAVPASTPVRLALARHLPSPSQHRQINRLTSPYMLTPRRGQATVDSIKYDLPRWEPCRSGDDAAVLVLNI